MAQRSVTQLKQKLGKCFEDAKAKVKLLSFTGTANDNAADEPFEMVSMAELYDNSDDDNDDQGLPHHRPQPMIPIVPAKHPPVPHAADNLN